MDERIEPVSGRVFHLDELSVGQRFGSASYEVGEAEIKAFAAQYDPQPFHLDAQAAQATLFKGLAASGWHTAAITMKLIVGDAAPLAGGIIGLGGELEWPRPTRPGDVLRVDSEVIEIVPSRSKPSQGVVKLRCETKNQRGEIVQVLIAKLVVPRRDR